MGWHLTISTTVAWNLGYTRANDGSGSDTRSRSGSNCRVGTEHANSRAELGPTKRHHMLSNMASNYLSMLRIGVSQDVLNKIVAILITGNIDQRDARTIQTAFTNTIQVAAKKLDAPNLETLFNNLRGELIHAVLSSKSDDMISCTAAISWSAMLANMLDAPVAELAVSYDINACQHLFNARTLNEKVSGIQFIGDHGNTLSSSRQ